MVYATLNCQFMSVTNLMGEKYFIWDEVTEGLSRAGISKTEDEQVKRWREQPHPVHASKIYCPHAYLRLNFKETLNQSEKITFRKHYLRKVSPNEPDVVILQDIKDLVMYLLTTSISPRFISLFHLPIIDRFLRGLILYFQFYIKIWEELMQERAATAKKAPNPLARGHRFKYANDMQTLRCMLGREYADLIIGCQDTVQYHHMTAGTKKALSITQSQGEKDLRMFEVLIPIAHRIVWIALERKHYHLIEVELHRLLRTEAYNTVGREAGNNVKQNMLDDDIRILQGTRKTLKRKLLKNSPLIQELVYSDCDYRVLALGIGNTDTCDERIIYLQNALLAEEEKLPKLGIKVGILGQNRTNYDVMLMLSEEDKFTAVKEAQLSEKERQESRKDYTSDANLVDMQKEVKCAGLPQPEPELELTRTFPIAITDLSPKGYQSAREKSRKKWITRELNRHNKIQADTYSIATTMDAK
ncbi:hypothetical protein KM043_009830 [Ampulex compressa]|nr:hypothetical protein KM043_009830 [Ampulex compressa]